MRLIVLDVAICPNFSGNAEGVFRVVDKLKGNSKCFQWGSINWIDFFNFVMPLDYWITGFFEKTISQKGTERSFCLPTQWYNWLWF